MINRFSIAALILWTSLIARAQDSGQSYKPFRYDEDWSFLANSANRDGWLDPLKYIRLGRYDYYLTLGGEIREKFELLDQPGFGTGSYDPYGYLLQRYLLLADFHLGHRFRIFTELQSGLEEGRVGGPRSTDADVLDGHQGFLDWRTTTGKFVRTIIRVGRQEVGFGSGRLIAPAEGLNLRRSMDGARIMADFGKLKWSASALRLVQANPGIFDNVPDHTQTLAGSGIETPWIGGETTRFALYYMWFDKKSSTFAKGSGREIRDTAGLHVWKAPGTALDYDDEAVFQWGSFHGSPIRAWALSESTGYTFDRLPLHPRIGVREDLASGDRGIATRTLGTFDPLFPNVSVYSGPSALLGASNLIDVTASFKLQLKTHAALVGRIILILASQPERLAIHTVQHATAHGDPRRGPVRRHSASRHIFLAGDETRLLHSYLYSLVYRLLLSSRPTRSWRELCWNLDCLSVLSGGTPPEDNTMHDSPEFHAAEAYPAAQNNLGQLYGHGLDVEKGVLGSVEPV